MLLRPQPPLPTPTASSANAFAREGGVEGGGQALTVRERRSSLVQDGLVAYLCSVLRETACSAACSVVHSSGVGGGFIQSKSSERGGSWARGQDEAGDARRQDKSHSAAGKIGRAHV